MPINIHSLLYFDTMAMIEQQYPLEKSDELKRQGQTPSNRGMFDQKLARNIYLHTILTESRDRHKDGTFGVKRSTPGGDTSFYLNHWYTKYIFAPPRQGNIPNAHFRGQLDVSRETAKGPQAAVRRQGLLSGEAETHEGGSAKQVSHAAAMTKGVQRMIRQIADAMEESLRSESRERRIIRSL